MQTTDRLFTPPGPQVTPAEAAQRRRDNTAAQSELFDHAADTPTACPACSSTQPDHACAGEALPLI